MVVNTCTVTSAAASDSRQKIRQAWRAGSGEILVTGCWATLEPAAAAGLPGVTRVIANPDKEGLVASLLCIPADKFHIELQARDPLPGIHWRTRAFIKAQDGCDNFAHTALPAWPVERAAASHSSSSGRCARSEQLAAPVRLSSGCIWPWAQILMKAALTAFDRGHSAGYRR